MPESDSGYNNKEPKADVKICDTCHGKGFVKDPKINFLGITLLGKEETCAGCPGTGLARAGKNH